MSVVGVVPDVEEIWRVFIYYVISVFYISFWLGLSILFSILFRSVATSCPGRRGSLDISLLFHFSWSGNSRQRHCSFKSGHGSAAGNSHQKCAPQGNDFSLFSHGTLYRFHRHHYRSHAKDDENSGFDGTHGGNALRKIPTPFPSPEYLVVFPSHYRPCRRDPDLLCPIL